MSTENAKHTPGPWRVSRAKNRSARIVGPPDSHSGGAVIANMIEEQNADLLAAAPELLKAATLQEEADDHWANCEECEGSESPELGCEIAFGLANDARLLRRAAIAKAEGIEPAPVATSTEE